MDGVKNEGSISLPEVPTTTHHMEGGHLIGPEDALHRVAHPHLGGSVLAATFVIEDPQVANFLQERSPDSVSVTPEGHLKVEVESHEIPVVRSAVYSGLTAEDLARTLMQRREHPARPHHTL